jgi:hypothetical protein
MPDGSAMESMPPPPTFKMPEPAGGLKENPLPRNFSDLPRHLLEDNTFARTDQQPDQPNKAEINQVLELLKQGSNKPEQTPPPSSEKPKTEVKVSAPEKIKSIWEKIKTVVRKVWYYGSLSFIWDKIFP